METIASKHIRIYDQLKSDRAALEAYWQDLTYYCLPRKAYITKIKSVGDRLPADVYDSTAIMSNAYFAAGMQAYMSSPQAKWFTIGLRNSNLLKYQHIKEYLRDCEDEIYSIINNSNFYQEDVESYLSLGSIGTDVLYSEEDTKEIVRFDSMPIESVVICANDQNRVDTAYIEYELTPQQAAGKFGEDNLSPEVKKKLIEGDYVSKFKYLLCIAPRGVYDSSKKDAKNMPFMALWIDKKEKAVVRESGFKEFPIFVSRFAKAKGDPYGYSPAMNIFADIKMTNQIAKTNIIAAQNVARPPLEIPDEAFLRPYNFNPGGVNIKNSGYPNEHIVPIVTGANVPMTLEYIRDHRERIAQAFYNDLFIMNQQIGKMTAFEVDVRNNQRMQLLGSAVGNVMRGKLSPVIERIYALAAKNGRLPKLPPELIDEEYIIIYISPLARAQKALEMNNINQAMSIIGQYIQVNPEVMDKIDFDELVNQIRDITELSPKIIRDDAEVDALRENRAQSNQMAQQLAAIQQGTETVKIASEADRNLADANNKGAPLAAGEKV